MIKFATNYPALEEAIDGHQHVKIVRWPTADGTLQRIRRAAWVCRTADVILLNQSPLDQLAFGLVRRLPVLQRARLIVLDHNFDWPQPGLVTALKNQIWRLAYSRVDYSVQHMYWCQELEEFFGIPEKKFKYMPFKVNSFEILKTLKAEEGDYVFTGGYSARDFDTFCKAMASLPYSGRISTSLSTYTRNVNRTRWTASHVPANVQLVEDTGDAWWHAIAKAKLVVFTIPKQTVSGAGISACMTALGLGKCVIFTECPATRGVFTNRQELAIVPPENPKDLANTIEELWEDDELRRSLALRGNQYASKIGGLEEHLKRIASLIF